LTIKSTSHTLCERYFFALTYLCLLMPVNIQLSKIDVLRIQESETRSQNALPAFRLLIPGF